MVRVVSYYAKGGSHSRSAVGDSDNNNRYRTFRNEPMSMIVEQQPHPEQWRQQVRFSIPRNGDSVAPPADGFRRYNEPQHQDHNVQSPSGSRWLRRICCWSCFSGFSACRQPMPNDERDQPFVAHTTANNSRASELFCCCGWPRQRRQKRFAAPPIAIVSARYRPPPSSQQQQLSRATAVVRTHRTMQGTNAIIIGGTVDEHHQSTASFANNRPSQKCWNWDDSFRSNADRFLQTLEEDSEEGVRSLRRGYGKSGMKLSYLFGGIEREGQWNAKRFLSSSFRQFRCLQTSHKHCDVRQLCCS